MHVFIYTSISNRWIGIFGIYNLSIVLCRVSLFYEGERDCTVYDIYVTTFGVLTNTVAMHPYFKHTQACISTEFFPYFEIKVCLTYTKWIQNYFFPFLFFFSLYLFYCVNEHSAFKSRILPSTPFYTFNIF